MGNLEEELNTDYQNRLEMALNNLRELLGAIFIQEQRNYDMLSIIADKLGADARGLVELHELGKVLAPAPSFIFEENEENDKK
jgi:hypothetical protein